MAEQEPAQNQHYVPKFILRNFLSNEASEQVSVFRKTTKKGFTTAIKNVMAERRFNEFLIPSGQLQSFEDAACSIENLVSPAYRDVVEHQRLKNDADEKQLLSILFAFQMLRTRSERDSFLRIETQFVDHIENLGFSMEDVEKGYSTPDSLIARPASWHQQLGNATKDRTKIATTTTDFSERLDTCFWAIDDFIIEGIRFQITPSNHMIKQLGLSPTHQNQICVLFAE